MREFLTTLPNGTRNLYRQLPQAELAAQMARSHVLALASVEEGLALVQGQAMACGCPVVATTATGAEDLFTDGVEGFIVPDRDTAALADRLQQMADDPVLRERMTAAALERVKTSRRMGPVRRAVGHAAAALTGRLPKDPRSTRAAIWTADSRRGDKLHLVAAHIVVVQVLEPAPHLFAS